MKRASKPSAHGKKAEQALKRAVAAVLEEHRRLGLPVAVMHNGKAVMLPVEKAIALSRKTKRPSRSSATLSTRPEKPTEGHV